MLEPCQESSYLQDSKQYSKAFCKHFIKDYTGFKHTVVTFKELKMYQFETFKINLN